MKNWTFGFIVLLIIALGAWWIWGEKTAQAPTSTNTQTSTSTASAQATTTPRTEVASATYRCDKSKTISAVFYNGPQAPMPAPGQPPTPTGSVDVSLDGGATTTLAQTISADGARYANSDESFVFWNKGDQALIMRNNAMDLSFKNCTQVK